MKECCLTCHAYALWDGDYCCTWHMKILSYCDDNYKAYNPERLIINKCDEYKQAENNKHLDMVIETWNKCNPLNKFDR